MFDQLVQAIRDRHRLGHTEDEIRQEVLAQGHTEETFAQAYATALSSEAATQSPMPQSPASGGLLNIGDFLSESLSLPFRYGRIIGEAAVAMFAILLLIGLSIGGVTWSLSGGMDVDRIAQPLLVGMLLLTLFSGLLVQFLNVALIRAWLQRATEGGYWQSLRWTMAHLVPLVLILVLYILAQQGGNLLLFIPGLIFVIYGHLCVHVFITEGRAGITAFKRSAHLVSGSFWGVFGRYLLLCIILGFVFSLGMLVTGLAPVIGTILFLVVMLYVIAVLTAASALVFEGLQAKKPVETFDPAGHSLMVIATYIFALLGVVILILWLWGTQNALNEIYRPTGFDNDFQLEGLSVPEVGDTDGPRAVRESAETAFVQQALASSRAQAEIYAANNGLAYTGVCTELTALLERADAISCNANETAYALSATVGDTTYCVDSGNFSGEITSPLGTKTSCE